MNNCRDLARANRSTDASSVRQNVSICENGPHGRGVHATAIIDAPVPSARPTTASTGCHPNNSRITRPLLVTFTGRPSGVWNSCSGLIPRQWNIVAARSAGPV